MTGAAGVRRAWSHGNPHPRLRGGQEDSATLEGQRLLPCGPALPLLGLHPTEVRARVHPRAGPRAFRAALFLRNPLPGAAQPPIGQQRDRRMSMHTEEWHTAVRTTDLRLHTARGDSRRCASEQRSWTHACVLRGAVYLKDKDRPSSSLLFEVGVVIRLGLGAGVLWLEENLRELWGSS